MGNHAGLCDVLISNGGATQSGGIAVSRLWCYSAPVLVFTRSRAESVKKLCILLLLGSAFSAGCQPSSPPASAPVLAQAAVAERVFEMRTYITHEGRLDALQRRFREHTTRLFEKHGMTNIGYWVPEDTARSHNTLIYILAYPSREAAQRSWEAFRADPEWQRVRTESEATGPIVLRVESVFLDATDYSPMR